MPASPGPLAIWNSRRARPAPRSPRAWAPRLLLALALPLLLAGCGPSFRPTGYLSDYEGLRFVGGNSDLAWEALPALGEAPDGLYLSEVRVRAGQFDDPGLREEIPELLRRRVYAWIIKRYGGGLLASSIEPNPEALKYRNRRACELELSITEAREGFGLARWLAGFFLGATTLQVEGRLRSYPEREIWARFACRVVFSGDSHFGLNAKALSDRYCLRVSADWAARDISELPALLFERWRPPPEPPE